MSAFDILWRLGLVLVLVLANGFFVASEFALVSVRPTRIDQLASRGSRVALLVRRARENPSQFIATVQVGVTVCSLLLGWIGEETLALILLRGLQAALPEPWASAVAHTVSAIVALILITYLHVMLGELVPKMIALQRAEGIILFTIRPIDALTRLARPFILVLYLGTSFVLRLLGLEYRSEEAAVHSPEELRLIFARSERAGAIEPGEREILDRVFGFGDLTAAEVMVPRTEVTAIPVEATLEQALDVALRHRYSRFPVYEGSLDNVVGVLLVKDLLNVIATPRRRGTVELRRLMREPLFVPSTLPALEVLARMKKTRAPLAVVLDEYGGTDGIVTLKDLVERIVGDVGDEYVAETPSLRTLPDGSVLADGLMLVDDFNEREGTHLDSSEVDTLGGLALARLGRMAVPGDEFELGEGWRARVERLDGRRVAELRIWPPAPEPEHDDRSGNGDAHDAEETSRQRPTAP